MAQKILIIDDDPAIHALIKARLARESVVFLSAANGAAGLAEACTKRPDLILLDVDMPPPDGFEVCRQLKREAVTRDIPVIFLTGETSAEQKLLGLEVGAVDYVTKPFEPAELRARVRASLRTKHLMDLLAQNEEQFRFLAENASDIISTHDLEGAFRYASPVCQHVLGLEPRELVGQRLTDLAHPDDLVELACALGLQGGGPGTDVRTVSFRARRRDGGHVWLESTCRLVRHARTHEPLELHVTSRDITLRKRAETLEQGRSRVLEMIASNQALPRVVEHLIEMVEHQHIGSCASAAILCDGRLEQIGSNLSDDLRGALNRRLLRLASAICSDAATRGQELVCCNLATDARFTDIREEAMRQNLSTCWAVPLRSSAGEAMGMFTVYLPGEGMEAAPAMPDPAARALLQMVARLVTIAAEHRELTHQLTYRAHHDSLTGLPNRLLFQDRLAQALASADRRRESVALLCIDLDRFKMINDTLGHHAGDQLLEQFTRRVQSALRQSDTLARMGGDEFSIVLPGLALQRCTEDAVAVARKILDLLRTPFQLVGQELFVTGSIGIALYPRDGIDPQTVQKNADVAMYRAKALGRNGFQCFAPEMAASMPDHFRMEGLLRCAVEAGELRLQYQPQVAADGRLRALEALMRWNQATLGNVPPSKFIPIAEETGLIVEMGQWALDEACRQARAWHDAMGTPVRIAVNISALQFAQDRFADTVVGTLSRHGLDPRCLELEITETLLMKNPREAGRKLSLIRATGVGIALDDFGTGYSSLAYLQTLPIDTLKMDASFLRDVESKSANTAALVRAIVSLGHSLGMQVLAEGVETAAQAEFLVRAGCDAMQGYHFARPMWPVEAAKLLSPITADLQSLPAHVSGERAAG